MKIEMVQKNNVWRCPPLLSVDPQSTAVSRPRSMTWGNRWWPAASAPAPRRFAPRRNARSTSGEAAVHHLESSGCTALIRFYRGCQCVCVCLCVCVKAGRRNLIGRSQLDCPLARWSPVHKRHHCLSAISFRCCSRVVLALKPPGWPTENWFNASLASATLNRNVREKTLFIYFFIFHKEQW